MARRLIARLALGLGLGLAACEDDATMRGLPAFASALPGHTAVVAWGGASGDLDALLPAALVGGLASLPTARIGLTALSDAPVGVRAWLADARGAGWQSLAGNEHFVAAASEFADEGVHLFVDLQQGVDAARAALSTGASGSDGLSSDRVGVVATFVQQRVWRALRLDALRWMVVRVGPLAPRNLAAVLASGDAERGVLAVLSERPLPAPATEIPVGKGIVLQATFAPKVIAAAIREVLNDDAGPLEALQQILSASGAVAAVGALEALDGAVVASFASGWAWAALGVRDAAAIEAALDAFAVARGDHWLALGTVRIELDDAVVRVSFGEVPLARRSVAATPAALHVEGIDVPFQLTASRTGARLRLQARLP